MHKKPEVGSVVSFVDAVGKSHTALVTAVWTETCVNVVFVSDNESESDTYGRQIKRQTSLVHKTLQPAHGWYWRWPEEELNPIQAPMAK